MSKIIQVKNYDPWLGSILILALVARLIFFVIYPTPEFPDATQYPINGAEIFAGEIVTDHKYMPLYPIWAHLTGGGNTQILADILLSTVTVWVIYILSVILFGDRLIGLFAAAFSAIYPHFLFYSVTRLTETSFTLLLLVSFWLFYRERIIPAMILSVLALLIRPSLDLLNPILPVFFVIFVYRSGWRSAIKYFCVYSLIYVVLMSPWWVHQYKKYDSFVRLSLNRGIVLYSGNNPLNRSGGGVWRKDNPDMEYEQKYRSIKDPLVRDQVMWQDAVDYIVAEPRHFIKMSGIKFLRFWRLYPYATEYQSWYIILTSVLSYGTVLLLSIGFIFRCKKEHFLRIFPVLVLFSYLTLIHMVTIGSIRYRFPLEPFLIIFAAHFAVSKGKNTNLIRKLKEKVALT